MRSTKLNSWLTSGALLLSIAALLSLSAISVAQTGEKSKKQHTNSNWTGFYAGLHLGYGLGDADTAVNALPNAEVFVNLADTTLHPDPKGVIGGVQAGYNWQIKHFVYGVEADFSGSGIGGDRYVSPIIQYNGTSYGGGSLLAHQNTNALGTLRPRIGYVVAPRLLIYGTGGLAMGHVNFSANTDFLPVGDEEYPAVSSGMKDGWVAGGGAEFALSRRWSIKAEYLKYDLGSTSVTANPTIPFPTGVTQFQTQYIQNTSANLITTGVNFRF
jgi:outer membrane immunogenic protein